MTEAPPLTPRARTVEDPQLQRIRSLSARWFAYGCLLLWFDYELPAPLEFDVFSDELGYALFAFAAWRLRTDGVAFVAAACCSAVGGLLGVLSMFGAEADALDWAQSCAPPLTVGLAALGSSRIAAIHEAWALERRLRDAGVVVLAMAGALLLGPRIAWVPGWIFLVLIVGNLAAFVTCAVTFAQLSGRLAQKLSKRPSRTARGGMNDVTDRGDGIARTTGSDLPS